MKFAKEIIALTLCLVLLFAAGCGGAPEQTEPVSENASEAVAGAAASAEDPSLTLREAGYTLKQAVVLSRHNIRSPLSDKDSLLGSVTTHDWTEWSSGTSELTVRGGVAENAMGQYFRQWAEDNGLFEPNAMPDESEVRIYANSKQRTLATAQSFAAGMFPVANIDVESHVEYDTMDPVFKPAFGYVSDSYTEAVVAQIDEMFRQNEEFKAELQKGFDLIEDVVDFKDSPAYTDGTVTELVTDDFEFGVELGEEPSVTGSLKLGCQISDALVLQSYEVTDNAAAGFGTDLTGEEWETVSSVKDMYGEVLFTAPLVCVNVAHPLLREIQSELDSSRKFTFLCGHDSNIASVLAALKTADYELDGTPETQPIGSKVVFEVWEKGGESFVNVRLVYASADELRDLAVLTPDTPPCSYEIEFDDISPNADGLYSMDDFSLKLQNAIDEYDMLVEKYGA